MGATYPGEIAARLEVYVTELCRPLFCRLDGKETAPEAGKITGNHTVFGFAALDIIMDEEGKLWLLEFNVNPSAPTPSVCSGEFIDHLGKFRLCFSNKYLLLII